MSFMEDFDHLRINMKDILLATNNFDRAKVIGHGGFGSVYKGELSSPKGKITVAFKQLNRRLGQGNVEFWKEVMMLSKYKHENLITLMHFCIDGDQMILVYEYASRGSLDKYLADPSALTWIQRLKISVGVARGLEFLHDPMKTQQRLIHRDIKSGNILLDENWMAKVSDFGLSKVAPANQKHSYLVSHVVGTPGYCDPLYMELGFLSKESDVYSFGVVLFEILCGRLCCEYHNHEPTKILVPKWRRCYEDKRLDEIILPDLRKQMERNSLKSFSAIAYKCLKKDRGDRPTMAQILLKLELSLKQQELLENHKKSVDFQELIQQNTSAWAKDIQECERNYQVDSKFGLSDSEVEMRLLKYGTNELEKHEGHSVFRLILDHFNETLVRFLLAAAVISFVLAWYEYDGEEAGEMELAAFVEPLVIFLILMVNAIVGVWQESNAEKALEALKEIQSEQATVIRNGRKIFSLPTKELVPGDIVELRVGDKIPADMRVISLFGSTLRVEQGSLTGESEAVSKTTKPVPEESDIQGKKCMVFAGTTVVNGNCICLVTETGMNTEIGKVHSQIQEAAQSEEDTPLKKKLNEFGEVLTLLIGLICLLVWLINVKYFLKWDYVDGWPSNFQFSFEKCAYYFEIAVALAVAAIPEGLPAVITTCLALGMRKMAQKNALVRKLPSVEALGCTTVICSDQTGILTTNQMAVAKLVAMGHGPRVVRSFNVEGTTYNPLDGKIQHWPAGRMDANLQTIAKIAALANDAGIEQSKKGYVATGMPTEAALKVLVEKMGLPAGSGSRSFTETDDLMVCCHEWSKTVRRIATLEFDRDRKSMGVIVSSKSGKNSLLVKGAVENLLERCSHLQLVDGSVVELDSMAETTILNSLNELSSSALHVLGFAYKKDPSEFTTYNGDDDHPAHNLLLDPTNYSKIESNLIFAGLAGLRDPPRKEVRQAIKDCRDAGIQVIVITGDNKNTAEAICREIGVFGQHQDIRFRSLTGREFMEHHDKKGHLAYKGGLLFSRAEPRHNKEIVRLLKDLGEVVAVTGDGVNDALVLKLADIGIAMGISGTKVAKEASDMVLADDNFSTIVAAVREGRSIYNNMKAFIRYLISSNIGVVASIFLTAAIGIPGGLIPVQLLWVNLVTDGPPATALGFNPPDKYIMKKSPRKSDDSLISPWILFRYLVIGLYVGIATVGIFIIWYTNDSFLGIVISQDGHTLVTFSQLTHWGQCETWENFTVSPFKAGDREFRFDSNPCDYFQGGKVKAMTLSLSVLVVSEMFNSLNALSEDESLLTMPPWVNPWLLMAMSVSFGLHFLILYVPFLAQVFSMVPLSLNEWLLVSAVAFPVIFIDEFLKFEGRIVIRSQTGVGRMEIKRKTD